MSKYKIGDIFQYTIGWARLIKIKITGVRGDFQLRKYEFGHYHWFPEQHIDDRLQLGIIVKIDNGDSVHKFDLGDEFVRVPTVDNPANKYKITGICRSHFTNEYQYSMSYDNSYFTFDEAVIERYLKDKIWARMDEQLLVNQYFESPTVSHDTHEVVNNVVMGKEFRYCRTCKVEV